MITLIIGENAYERDQAISRISAEFSGEPERIDGGKMSLQDLAQLTQGLSLFASHRLVFIRDLSDNKDVWNELPAYTEAMPPEVHLVVIEPKPDKRTKTYKALKATANVIECNPFSERDTSRASAWLSQYAKASGIQLAPAAASELVRRVGVDQYTLKNELERLSVLGEVTKERVETYTEAASHDNAYALLEMAIEGDARALQQKIRALRTSEDAYMTFGLLVSQVYALAGLVLIDNEADVAHILGVHPFVLKNLRTAARHLDRRRLEVITRHFADVDMQLKSTSSDPWLAIEVALSSIAESHQ